METRSFGQKPSLASLMMRGETFFDGLLTEGTREKVIRRSRHIGKIARSAASIAGETTQHEGDSEAAQLVFAAYLSLGRITCRAISELGVEEAHNALTSEASHQTLLEASKNLASLPFDDVARQYASTGAWYDLTSQSLDWQAGVVIPKRYYGKGCPYALGNPEKATYFNTCTDEIVTTYIDAHKEATPRSQLDYMKSRIPLMNKRPSGRP